MADLRKSGINALGDVPWGSHFCHFYESKQDLLDVLIPYFNAGLDNNELCVWAVLDPLNEEEAKNALARAVPQADRRLAAGDIEIVPYEQWYLQGGAFDLDRVLHAGLEKLHEALTRGYAGMRMNGNEVWPTKTGWTDFCRYEQRLDRLIATERMIVLCSYPLAATTAGHSFDIVRLHQVALAKRQGNWEVMETPELQQAKAEIKKLNEELEQRVMERTLELAVTNESLRAEMKERQKAEEALRALSERLQHVREEEGTRIAREIHDELGSALSRLKWDLEGLDRMIAEPGDGSPRLDLREELDTMQKLADTIIDIVRRIASELRPSVLDDLGLVEAIEWQAEQFQARTGIHTHCECSVEKADLDPQQSTAVFRIFQEALTNVLRHSKASQVDVHVEEEPAGLWIRIKDNGRGITDAQKSAPQSLGLLGMHERARLAGGTIEISGAKGNGTVVTVRIPLASHDGQ